MSIDRWDWKMFDGGGYTTPRDKDKRTNEHIKYMLARTQSMFKYEGLPAEITQRNIELMLQTNGFIAIPKPDIVPNSNGKMYAFARGAFLGGRLNEYYMPTLCNISSPFLNWSDTLKIPDEVIIIPNDSLYMGLLPVFNRYASALTDNELTMFITAINIRMISLIATSDDNGEKKAKEFLKQIENGDLGVLADGDFFETLKTLPYSNHTTNIITQLIENEQYLKASAFNEIGLNSNYNMKREAINSNEAQLNEDALLPLIDDMRNCRKIGFEKVNESFNTSIKIDFNSSWRDVQKREKEDIEIVENN